MSSVEPMIIKPAIGCRVPFEAEKHWQALPKK
jgi:hypothetical protein